MHPKRDVVEYTNHMVRTCDLDSASIMICKTDRDQGSLSYIYNTGLKSEFLHCYKTDRIFLHDPFLEDYRPDRRFTFLTWGLPKKQPVRSSLDYLNLIDRYSVAPVGASIVAINPEVSLIVGAHRRTSKQERQDISIPLLENHIQKLSNMVVLDLLTILTSQPGGSEVLGRAYREDNAADPTSELTSREREIASLVCLGLRNRQIGTQLGLSEHTVENHLRNIYAKLAIKNRASLVSKISRIL